MFYEMFEERGVRSHGYLNAHNWNQPRPAHEDDGRARGAVQAKKPEPREWHYNIILPGTS